MTFEKFARWCGQVNTGLPITFLLGFYVSLVVKRWWEQYCYLPWPDTTAFLLRGLVTAGEDQEQNKMIRRTVVRYLLLSYVLCIRRLSASLRKRFPNTQEIIRTGLMRPDEAARIGDEASWDIYESNWWLPLKWSTELVCQAMTEGKIKIPPGYNSLLNSIAAFRSSLTQVTTITEHLTDPNDLFDFLLSSRWRPMDTSLCPWSTHRSGRNSRVPLHSPYFPSGGHTRCLLLLRCGSHWGTVAHQEGKVRNYDVDINHTIYKPFRELNVSSRFMI